jgi:hypothetical protein
MMLVDGTFRTFSVMMLMFVAMTIVAVMMRMLVRMAIVTVVVLVLIGVAILAVVMRVLVGVSVVAMVVCVVVCMLGARMSRRAHAQGSEQRQRERGATPGRTRTLRSKHRAHSPCHHGGPDCPPLISASLAGHSMMSISFDDGSGRLPSGGALQNFCVSTMAPACSCMLTWRRKDMPSRISTG